MKSKITAIRTSVREDWLDKFVKDHFTPPEKDNATVDVQNEADRQAELTKAVHDMWEHGTGAYFIHESGFLEHIPLEKLLIPPTDK